MFNHPKRPAPEPYASAALWLIYRVSLFIRNNNITDRQVSDLGDAIHNIPQSLTEYGYYFDEKIIRQDLEAYDVKWTKSSDDFSLIRNLDAGMIQAQDWLNKTGN